MSMAPRPLAILVRRVSFDVLSPEALSSPSCYRMAMFARWLSLLTGLVLWTSGVPAGANVGCVLELADDPREAGETVAGHLRAQLSPSPATGVVEVRYEPWGGLIVEVLTETLRNGWMTRFWRGFEGYPVDVLVNVEGLVKLIPALAAADGLAFGVVVPRVPVEPRQKGPADRMTVQLRAQFAIDRFRGAWRADRPVALAVYGPAPGAPLDAFSDVETFKNKVTCDHPDVSWIYEQAGSGNVPRPTVAVVVKAKTPEAFLRLLDESEVLVASSADVVAGFGLPGK